MWDRPISFAFPLLFCIILFLNQPSAMILPIRPTSKPDELLNSTFVTIAQNIASGLWNLANSPQIQLSEAKLRSVYLTSRVPSTEGRPLPQHSNLDLFHFIALSLSTGGPAPVGRPRDWIYFRNNFPSNWGQWVKPRIHLFGLPEAAYPSEIRWEQVSARMSVVYAERLMRAAGYRDTYAVVFLADQYGNGDLTWSFDYYAGSDNAKVSVHVWTEAVTFSPV